MLDWVNQNDSKLWGSGVVGAVAFPSLLGVFQHTVFKHLRVSVSSKASSFLGGASVALAAYGASWASLQVISFLRENGTDLVSISSPELVVSTAGSLLVFKVLGGRFKAVLPSNLLHPGAFAHEWVPAKAEQFATGREKAILKVIGEKYGCHSCGKKPMSGFVADHQPPRMVNKTNVDLTTSSGMNWYYVRFYPQCRKCSNMQGIAMTKHGLKNKHKDFIVTHFTSLRVWHLFLPLPLATVYGKEYLRMQATPLPLTTVNETRQKTEKTTPSKERKKATEHVTAEKQGEKEESRVDLTEPVWLNEFPLLIVWNKFVRFLDSFSNPMDAFHITLWAFSIIAALGTM